MNYILSFLVLFAFSLKAFSQQKASKFENYQTGEFTGLDDFEKLDSLEKEMATEFGDLSFNRSRLTIRDLTDTASENSFPPYINALSQAIFYADTLRVSTGIGFFGNMGVQILMHGSQFQIIYFQDADDSKVFKISENDKKFLSLIQVPALEKNLTFVKPPKYENGEILTCRFEMTTLPFFEKEDGTLVKRQYNISGIFRCSVRKFENKNYR